MKRPWTADLAVVDVPIIPVPKPVTFIYPYYENPQFLARQLDIWRSYPSDLRDQLSVIVVDDGSPTHPLLQVLEGQTLPDRFRAFRIETDVRWNWLAARNIGAHHADGWLLMTDMDHVVPQQTLRALVYGRHAPSVIYGFSRVEHTGEDRSAHPNSWFMTRNRFWKVGGYDETLSGHYGTDGDWRRRMAAVAEIQILRNYLVRYEFQGDSSTTQYQRKQPEDAAVKRLVSARRPGWQPKTLSFPYHELRLAVPA